MLLFKTLLVLVAFTKCSHTYNASWEYQNELIVYQNLDELLNYFRNDPNPLAKNIIETFLMECRFPRNRNIAPVGPVIVIEGNHRKIRDYVSKGLAYMLNARAICHPAPCLRKFLSLIPKGSPLRRAFFHLSNYAASFFIMSRPSTITIINGYWTEQLAFTMAHHYPPGELPPPTDDIFKFPTDMLVPDAIFYLNFADSHLNSYATTRNPWTWKPRTMEVMRHLQFSQPITFVDTKPVMKLNTEEVYRHLLQHPIQSKIALFSNKTKKQS